MNENSNIYRETYFLKEKFLILETDFQFQKHIRKHIKLREHIRLQPNSKNYFKGLYR